MGVNNVPTVTARQCTGRESNLQPFDRESNALPLHHRATLACDNLKCGTFLEHVHNFSNVLPSAINGWYTIQQTSNLTARVQLNSPFHSHDYFHETRHHFSKTYSSVKNMICHELLQIWFVLWRSFSFQQAFLSKTKTLIKYRMTNSRYWLTDKFHRMVLILNVSLLPYSDTKHFITLQWHYIGIIWWNFHEFLEIYLWIWACFQKVPVKWHVIATHCPNQ